MKTFKKFLIYVCCLLVSEVNAQKIYTLLSPDKKLETTISVGEILTYSLKVEGTEVLSPSSISMSLGNGSIWGYKPKISKVSMKHIDATIESPFYRSSSVRDHYNTILLRFRGKWGIEFRAYNDGLAYRLISYMKHPFIINNEQVNFLFPEDFKATVPYVYGPQRAVQRQFANSFENIYTDGNISSLNPERLMFLPLVVEASNGIKLGITESDLNDYPGLFLQKGQGGFQGTFAPYPKTVKQGGHNRLQMLVTESEPI